LQDPLPLGDGQRQVLDSTCRTGRTRLSPRRDGGGAGRVDDDPAFDVATIGIIGGGKAKAEEDEMAAEEEGEEEERKRCPAPLP